MNIHNLPVNPKGGPALSPLIFSGINDVPENRRLGLGYHQLYDPQAQVGLVAKLPEISRVGDTIKLYWDGVLVQEYDLDAGTIDKGMLSFGVSPGNIFDPQGVVYYSLYDHEAEDLRESDPRTIAVNRRVPGGLDPDTGTAINDNLVPATVTPDPVEDPGVPVTVEVAPWVYQELGDELTVLWNNIRVNLPPLQSLGPQTVSIPREVLEAAGSSDQLLVNYEIRDIVDNYSLVSQPVYVRVDIDPNALTAPRVDEANQTTLVLDLEALGDDDAHVSIPSYSGNGRSYEVTLVWLGKTPSHEIELKLPPQTIRDPDFERARFTIPNADIKQIAGGSAVVRYTLTQEGVPGDPKRSRTKTITLTGLPVQLVAPVVDEANGSEIDLSTITGPAVTVRIAAYAGQAVDDKVLLNWQGTDAGGKPVNYLDEYVIKAGEETRPTLFTVDRVGYLDPLADGTLSLSYQVIFAATNLPQNSPVTRYTVTGAGDEPVSDAESFELAANGPLPLNTPVSFASRLKVTVIASRADSAIINPGINEFGNHALYCAGLHKLKLEFGGEIRTFIFSHAITSTEQNRLEFFNKAGQLVHAINLQRIPVGSVVQGENVPLPAACVYAELLVDTNGTIIDNLIWLE